MFAGKKILVLGCGTWQVPWLKRAREMGMTVFATDWSADPDGKQYADVFEQIDLKDKEGSLAFAKKHQVEAVFTSADVGVQTAAYVAKNLGLPYHSTEVAFRATNKEAMRQRAKEIGLGIPGFQSCSSLEEALEAAANFGYPVILKPVDSASSRGVSVVENETELRAFFDTSLSASVSGTVLVEEFMTGTEGSVEALVANGKAVILGICDKAKSPLPYRYDLQLNYPGNYSENQFRNIESFIQKLVSGYEIQNGVIHVEIMVHEQDVRLIEFAIRGCGSKVITHLMPASRGFDVLTWLLSAAFGSIAPISLTQYKPGMLKFIMLPQGVIASVSGIETAKQIDGVLDCDIERKAGDQIGIIPDGRSRPGYLLAVADSKTQLEEVVQRAMETIKVTME